MDFGGFLPTGNGEGVCTSKKATHPAFAGTHLQFHPLSLGERKLFQDVWKYLILLSVKVCVGFFSNKCKLVFTGYH